MKLHLLSGFLGSGKTTAIQHASKYLLQKNIRTGVITNDLGTKLVDGDFFKSLEIPEEQVAGSCFCCNYNTLNQKIESLIETYNLHTIFAESVGSCTELAATIFKPLLQFRPHFQELLYSLLKEKQRLYDDDARYNYHKQLQEAGIIVVSKIDLISKNKVEGLKQMIKEIIKIKLFIIKIPSIQIV